MTGAARTIELSLISHTNTGKTALARTLLSRDIGEVRDAAHVTQEASRHEMIATAAGDRLVLWDTPGFGDSARLARRLAQHGNPIGWFLGEVWDRLRDRPLWLAQKAVANVKAQASVVLYLVNAAEDPGDAGYLAPEMQVLAWVGKPVVVLLNQTGRPQPRAEEAREEARWRVALAPWPLASRVLTLDAFARCWPQETVLLQAVVAALDGAARAAAERLVAAWTDRNVARFDAAMAALAAPIAKAARDRATLPAPGLRGTLRGIGRAMGIGRDTADPATTRALQSCAERLSRDVRASTEALIAIHGLEGRAADEVTARLASSIVAEAPASEGKAALVGGIVSGALSGLVADLAAGGLTLGAGMVAGGLVGALGGAGFARGYNVVRGTRESTVRWSAEFLDSLVTGAMLRYLAVAHHGRGRGAYVESGVPAFWRAQVARSVARHRGAWDALWVARSAGPADELVDGVRVALRAATLDALAGLYPEAQLDVPPVPDTAPGEDEVTLPPFPPSRGEAAP